MFFSVKVMHAEGIAFILADVNRGNLKASNQTRETTFVSLVEGLTELPHYGYNGLRQPVGSYIAR